jgi:hypothetical protein
MIPPAGFPTMGALPLIKPGGREANKSGALRARPSCFLCILSDNTVMSQSTKQLEARLQRVERELARLKTAVKRESGKPWYREIVGSFAGDEAFAEITRLGRLIRQGKIKG